MKKLEMTETILAAKASSGFRWEEISQSVGLSPVFLTSACLGMNSLEAEHAKKLCAALDLPDTVAHALEQFPTKTWEQAIPTDPLVYRLYEVVGVYGDTIKELIQEKCGDGIMSAIDFTMTIDKKENPAGDRVVITMDGKFLPYKRW